MNNNQESDTVPAVASLALYMVRRKNNPPLRFTGRVIGEAEVHHRDNDFFRRVTVYITSGGNYIAESVCDASFLERADRDAFSATNPAAVIDWLRDDHGEIDEVAGLALLRAASEDIAFEAAYAEDVA